MTRCPGQDFRKVTVGLHPCPGCAEKVEIFSDELRRRCPRCGTMVLAEETPSCVEWCQAARECIGPERYERVMRAIKGEGSEEESDR